MSFFKRPKPTDIRNPEPDKEYRFVDPKNLDSKQDLGYRPVDPNKSKTRPAIGGKVEDGKVWGGGMVLAEMPRKQREARRKAFNAFVDKKKEDGEKAMQELYQFEQLDQPAQSHGVSVNIPFEIPKEDRRFKRGRRRKVEVEEQAEAV